MNIDKEELRVFYRFIGGFSLGGRLRLCEKIGLDKVPSRIQVYDDGNQEETDLNLFLRIIAEGKFEALKAELTLEVTAE